MGKLLTLASCRDLIEDCVEEQRAARQELREIRAEQHRREREEAAHRCIHLLKSQCCVAFWLCVFSPFGRRNLNMYKLSHYIFMDVL